MGLLPSIASTLAYSLPAGPAGLVWVSDSEDSIEIESTLTGYGKINITQGWFVASGFIFIVGLAMADLGSAMPTSGGLYWWTHYFASPRTRNALSFLVGYSNTLGEFSYPRHNYVYLPFAGLVGGLCSIDYGFALMFLSVIVIARNGEWEPSNGVVYAVFMGCVLLHGVLASTLSSIMGRLQTVFVVANFILIAATIIALPIGRSSKRNNGKFIFGTTANMTTWPTGWGE